MPVLNSSIENKIKPYPELAKTKFHEIRSLIFEVARDNELGDIEETLKWGQPSYLCKSGSTIRVDWQNGVPDSIGLFFNCKTILVETFREIFGESLVYEGNRIVYVPLDKATPLELETCIFMALNYHKLKKLPLLGA